MISHVSGFKATQGRQLDMQLARYRDLEGLEKQESDLKSIFLFCSGTVFTVPREIVFGTMS